MIFEDDRFQAFAVFSGLVGVLGPFMAISKWNQGSRTPAPRKVKLVIWAAFLTIVVVVDLIAVLKATHRL